MKLTIMRRALVAAIDQGTTGTRCAVFDGSGKMIGWAYKKHKQIYPQEKFVEHDPIEILNNVRFVLKQAVRNAKADPKEIASIGITNQRETVVAWNKRNGKPFYNAIVWQDTRTDRYVSEIKQEKIASYIRKKTGLKISTYFSAPKIRWLKDNNVKFRDALKTNEALVGNIDSWLIWNLTGGESFHTDYTNASRTMLMDLEKHRWDSDLLDFFDIPEGSLPEIGTSLSKEGFGKLKEKGFQNAVINSDLGDQQAALFGERCFSEGDTKITYGTGSFILQNVGKRVSKSETNLISTCAYGNVDGTCNYALEGSTRVAGNIFGWLIDKVNMFRSMEEIESYFDRKYESSVYFVPAFGGLLAPYWDASARGLIIGLNDNSSKKDVVKAAYEAICMQVSDIFDLLRPAKNEIKVDGGVSVNDDIMQMQADVLGRKLFRSDMRESTVFGAAIAAGFSAGIWTFDDIKQFYRSGKLFYPEGNEEEINQRKKYWKKAVERSLYWLD